MNKIRLKLVNPEGEEILEKDEDSPGENIATITASDQEALKSLKECLEVVKKREVSLGDKLQKSKFLVTKYGQYQSANYSMIS